MSLDTRDDYLTTDPNDGELCEHKRLKPCIFCTMERLDELDEARREIKDADQ